MKMNTIMRRLAMHVPRSMAYGSGLLAISASGCAALYAEGDDDVSTAAAEQQLEAGWDVGASGQPLMFAGAQPRDVAGRDAWRDAMPTLAARLAPASPRWEPFYGPALFQSLGAPRNDGLRTAARPVWTPEMHVAEQRGNALLALLVDGDRRCPTDMAVVIDVPGPEAVAIAATLAPCFDPVFFFDNWPHPLGVVPSHLTLGAALYHLPTFDDARARRGAGAPPMFVLDRNRLAPYVDDPARFDNRYLARLPEAGPLATAGIRHVLYLTPDESVTVEADDLNQDLVALDHLGLDVRMLAMSDFKPPAATDPDAGVQDPNYYLGGQPIPHDWFWSWFGWGGGAAPPPPAGVGARCHYHPIYRPTFTSAFHGSPVGAASPNGSAWIGGGFHGRPSSFGSGSGFRSGSLGRMHSSFSG